MFENFPYTDMHQLNLDWIIKIAKDFLDQYTHLQQLITDGEASLQNLTDEGVQAIVTRTEQGEASLQHLIDEGVQTLITKTDQLETLLNEWYETHSADIANQLVDALADLNAWYQAHMGYLDQYVTDSIAAFGTAADAKAAQTIASIPADYTALSNLVSGHTAGLLLTHNPIIFPDNLIAVDECIDGAYINYQTGVVTQAEGYFCTGFIPCESSVKYTTNKGRNYAWYDANKNYIAGQAGDFANTIIVCPANGKYLRYTINKTTDGINNPIFLYFRKSENTKTLVSPIANKNVIKGIQFPGNLITDTNWVDNSYINYNNGIAQVYDTGYFRTDYIEVTPGHSYRANKGRNFAWYASDYSYIAGEPGPGTIQSAAGAMAPVNARYIRFTINKTSDGISDPSLLYFADVLDYSDTVIINGAKLNTWFNKKKVNWIGDSIVDGPDFDEIVCQAVGLQKDNEYGINGSTIALNGDGTDGRNAICERYSDMTNDADIIIVSAGTNDFEYAWSPIGDINSDAHTTFYGALKALCNGLINKYPNKVICFTTPIKRAQPFENGNGGTYTPDNVMTTPFSKNKYGKTLGDYADIIKEVCGYYSIPVLDLYRESLLNPHITAQQYLFDQYLTHPSVYAQKIMARRVSGWLTQLVFPIE